jgi:hypothetical protein
MRPRGSVLAIAIVCVFLVAGVATLLARSAAVRTQARRADVEREATLRKAEAAFEVARLAVERGRLKAGETIETEGTSVACATVPGGIALTATAEMPETSSSSLKRRLHLRRTLIPSGSATQATAWEMDWETVVLQPATSGKR